VDGGWFLPTGYDGETGRVTAPEDMMLSAGVDYPEDYTDVLPMHRDIEG